jgi:hypothetical protein
MVSNQTCGCKLHKNLEECKMAVKQKMIKPKIIAMKAIKDKKLTLELIAGIASDIPEIKYKSGKALILVSEENPKLIYPNWDKIVKLLDSENTFMKSIGVMIIANLAVVDSKNRFDIIFEKYYKLIDDDSMITAANLVGHSGKIAKVKPKLQERITNKLLSIDRTHHSSECRNIIKGKAILSLDQYFEEARNKKKIINFVKKELKNRRPATRKKAEQFLKKWVVS